MMQLQTEKPRLTATQKTLFVLPALVVVHIAYYWPQLPERMASHFGPGGKADGWMSKQENMIFYLALVSISAALWASIGWILKKSPDESINIPNKEYWLAPERREQTLMRMGHQLSTFGIATVAFLMAVMHSVFLANLNGGKQLGALFFIYLAGFLAYTGIWAYQMVKGSKVPEAP